MGKPLDEGTAQRIRQAARAVFLEKGMDGARMQEIADRAGINKALLHYYFRSKAELFRVVFRQAIREIIPQVQAVLQEVRPIREKLRLFVRTYFEQIRAHPIVPRFVLYELSKSPETLLAELSEAMRLGAPERPPMPQLLLAELRSAQQQGELPPYPPEHLLTNLLALCVFPFIARPMLQHFLQLDDPAFEAFLDERSAAIEQFLDRALRP